MSQLTLRRVATIQRGAGFPHDDQGSVGGELPFFKVGDFARPGNERVLTSCGNWVSAQAARRLGAVPVPPGSVLLPKIGAALLGNARRITSQVSVFDNNVLAVVPNSVDSRYLHYWLSTVDLRPLANPGPIPSLNDGALLDLPLPDSDRETQGAIADFLDTEAARIDALITKKRRMIELMRERFWHSVDSKFSALEHVPRHKLTWLAHTWCDGPFGSALTSAHYSDSGARVVRLGNVGRGEFVNLDAAFVPVEYFESLRRHDVLEGDLIVAGLGDEKRPLARACVAPALGPAMVKADCFRFRLRTELVSPDFVAWYLSSPSAVAASALLAQGSTRARANLATVCGLRVPLPRQSIQQLVVVRIQRERAAMSDVATRLKQQIRLLEERRQALITAAVTGELEVPGVAA